MDISEWMTTRSEALLRFAYLQSGSVEAAEDLVQDVLVEILRRQRRNPPIESLDAYARRAVINRSTSAWRNARKRRDAQLHVHERAHQSDPIDQTVCNEQVLKSALARLDSRTRAALILRFLEDLPYVDISDVLGCRESTARSLVSRGLNRLRQDELLMDRQDETNG